MNLNDKQKAELADAMWLTEFIGKLALVLEEHGNMPVVIQSSDSGNFLDVPKKFELTELYPSDMAYSDLTIEEIDAAKICDALAITCNNEGN